MKTKIYFLLAILAAIFLTACGKTSTNKDGKDAANAASDTHTSRNSLDWKGVYKGTLPCADCSGIETSLALNDSTYTLRTKYTGKNDAVREISGAFEWNDKGNTITLKDINPQEQPTQYFVGENKLTQLDLGGNKIEGKLADNYILEKIVPDNSIFGKGWKLVELNGQPVKKTDGAWEPFIVIAKGEKNVNGNGSCNAFFGQYELDEAANRISFSKMASTQMACPALDIEQRFMEILQTVDNYSLNGDKLTLNKARMAPLAVLEAIYVY